MKGLVSTIDIRRHIDSCYCVVENRVDFKSIEVANNQQGRIAQRIPVQLELAIGGGQILVTSFVLPCEAILTPYVGEAILS